MASSKVTASVGLCIRCSRVISYICHQSPAFICSANVSGNDSGLLVGLIPKYGNLQGWEPGKYRVVQLRSGELSALALKAMLAFM